MEEEIQMNRAKAGIEVGSCLDCFILVEHRTNLVPGDAIHLVHDIDHTAYNQVAGHWRMPG